MWKKLAYYRCKVDQAKDKCSDAEQMLGHQLISAPVKAPQSKENKTATQKKQADDKVLVVTLGEERERERLRNDQ